MKPRFHSFVSGFLSCALIMGLPLSALAISGRMTIEVDPINIQVNGQTFAPTDVTGKEVPVFAYQGTTYAPLRALAEAYGLEVGYDAAANMATVADPEAKPVNTPAPDTTAKVDYSDWSAEDEAAYQEFKAKWELEYKGYDPNQDNSTYYWAKTVDNTIDDMKSFLLDNIAFATRMMMELDWKTLDGFVVFYNENEQSFIKVINGEPQMKAW